MLPQSLTTHRLLLRAPQPADGRKIFDAYTQSAEVAHYMVWRPHTAVSQTQAFIAECMGCASIERLNIGPLPTNRLTWDQPHEGNLFTHLYKQRALQHAPGAARAAAV